MKECFLSLGTIEKGFYMSPELICQHKMIIVSQSDRATQICSLLNKKRFSCISEKSVKAANERLAQQQFDVSLVCENSAGRMLKKFCLQARRGNPSITIIASLLQKNPSLEMSLFDAGLDDIITDDTPAQSVVKRIIVRHKLRQASNAERPICQVGNSLVDWEAYQVWNQGKLYTISKTLTLLLKYLLKNSGRAISREEAAEILWADSIVDPEGKNLDMQIMKLRRIVETNPKKPKLIQTVRGVGYAYLPKI